MSWFSLALHGKSAWDSHSLINNVCTGRIFGKLVYKHFLQNSAINQRIRNAISLSFASRLSPRLLPLSRKMAAKVLEKSIREEKLIHVTSRVKRQIAQITVGDLIAYGKTGLDILKFAAYNYLDNCKIPKNTKLVSSSPPQPPKADSYSEERKEVVELIKKFQLKKASQKLTILSLRPSCERAMQAGLAALSKASAGAAYDYAIHKTISLTLVPVCYQLFVSACEWTAHHYAGNYLGDQLGFVADQLPSTSHVFWAATALNLADMGYRLWRLSVRKSELGADSDKDELKALTFKHVREPAAKKLRENRVLKFIGVSEDDSKIYSIVQVLVNEAVDFYWNDLRQTKFLCLPLVS